MRRAPLALFAVALLGATPAAHAQGPCNEASLRAFIRDLQTGQLKWSALSPQLAQTIQVQTGGTGRYEQLAQLGEPASVSLVGTQPLPQGIVCGYRTVFPAAYGSGLLQAAFFRFADSGGSTPDATPPQPTGGGGSTKQPTPGEPVPSGTSEACKLYPNLC
jgi:hypothetical protein